MKREHLLALLGRYVNIRYEEDGEWKEIYVRLIDVEDETITVKDYLNLKKIPINSLIEIWI